MQYLISLITEFFSLRPFRWVVGLDRSCTEIVTRRRSARISSGSGRDCLLITQAMRATGSRWSSSPTLAIQQVMRALLSKPAMLISFPPLDLLLSHQVCSCLERRSTKRQGSVKRLGVFSCSVSTGRMWWPAGLAEKKWRDELLRGEAPHSLSHSWPNLF